MHIIGSPQKKQNTEKLGNLFIEFLRKADGMGAQYDDMTLNGLVGKSGIASYGFPPHIGKVRLDEHEYYAHSIKGIIDKGAKVRVIEKRGLSLFVERYKTDRTGFPPSRE